jgi:hypothetical protein
MQAIFEPKENRFSSLSKEYNMIGFGFDISPTKNQICPTGNCTYEFEDGELRENSILGGYTLEGNLRPIISEGNSNGSKLYEVVGDLEVDESIKEQGGKLIDLVTGSLNIPEIGYYKVVNGSMTFQYEEGVLALQAEI